MESESIHSPLGISKSLWEDKDAWESGLITQLMTGMMATTTQLKIGMDNHITPMEWALTSTGLIAKTMAIGNLTSMTKPATIPSKTSMMVASCTKMESGTVAKTTMTLWVMPNMNSQRAQFPSKLMILAIDEFLITA